MKTQSFYRTVIQLSGEDNQQTVERATAAVLHALRDRLTPDEADQVMAQLPRGLQQVWEAGDTLGRVPLKLHLTEFYDRVKREAKLGTGSEARWMTLSVFAALNLQISAGEAKDVLAQLPQDLKEIWLEAVEGASDLRRSSLSK